MNDLKLRRAIIKAAQEFNTSGLSTGTSGNLSARTGRGYLISPSGVAYASLVPGSLVEMDLDGNRLDGDRVPSSEWCFHGVIYRDRPEVGAIVHVHSPYATAVACTRQDIPPFHYQIAVTGAGTIRCAAYATFGTRKLAVNARQALRGSKACLLANHGQIAVGETVAAAMAMAREVETLAMQYSLARQLGKPVLLDKREMQVNIEKFNRYGREGD